MGRRRPQGCGAGGPRDPVGPPLQLSILQHRHGNLSAATTFPNIPRPPQALLLAELRLRRALSDSRMGRKEVFICWLALAILPSLDSVTPSAKWRGWNGGGPWRAGHPSPAWTCGARGQLTCEGWGSGRVQKDRGFWVLPHSSAPGLAQRGRASGPSSHSKRRGAGWKGEGLCHRTASWSCHTG